MIKKTGGFSEQGKRSVNQDRILYVSDQSKGLFVVADGVGGLLHGERASEMIRSSFYVWWNDRGKWLDDSTLEEDIEEIREELSEINRKIYVSGIQGDFSASTIVLLWIKKAYYALFWSGDSRCYLAKKQYLNTLIVQMTVDDTWENQIKQKQQGHFSEEELKKFPDYGKLVHALGKTERFSCNIRTGETCGNMLFVLCSDGVYKYMEPGIFKTVIRKFYRERSEEDFFKRIQWYIEKEKAPDNLSLIYVRL